MSNVERTTVWQQIQQGVREAERLFARKDYNLVMIKSRQVLEFMIRCMAEKACLVEGDLADTIDQLYEGRWIDRTTRDNYHTIRILGNKAVHEGGSGSHDASQAFQLLTQEVETFASVLNGGRPARSAQPVRNGAARQPVRQNSSGRRTPPSRNSQGGSRQGSRQGTRSGPPRQGGGRKRRRKRVSPLFYIARFLIPVVVIILLVALIVFLLPKKDKEEKDPSTTTATVTMATTAPPATRPPQTETQPPETQAPPERYRIKGSNVNVRSKASTEGDSRILAKLANGTEVNYVKRYNNDWAVITYDNQEAYVASRYLERIEPESGEQEETGVSVESSQAP